MILIGAAEISLSSNGDAVFDNVLLTTIKGTAQRIVVSSVGINHTIVERDATRIIVLVKSFGGIAESHTAGSHIVGLGRIAAELESVSVARKSHHPSPE